MAKKSTKRSAKAPGKSPKRAATKKKSVRKAAPKKAVKKVLARGLRAKRWEVYCSTDGSLGTFTSYADAVAKKNRHTKSHDVRIIGGQ